MAARAYWQGQIHEPSGKPINYEKVVQGIGPVDRDEIVKGYEVSKGNFVLLDDDEIEAAKVESKRTLDLVQFVDANEIDVFYFEKPYYVVPQDDLAEEAYIVLRDALKAKKKLALGQLSVRGREQLVSLKPCGKGIVMETLRYEDEVRRAQTYFKDIAATKPAKPMLDLAGSLIDQKTGPFDAGEFHDRYVEALKRLIDKKAKSKGKKVIEEVEEPAARGSNVIDLMAALKQSVGGKSAANDAGDKKPAAKKSAAKKAAAPSKARKRA